MSTDPKDEFEITSGQVGSVAGRDVHYHQGQPVKEPGTKERKSATMERHILDTLTAMQRENSDITKTLTRLETNQVHILRRLDALESEVQHHNRVCSANGSVLTRRELRTMSVVAIAAFFGIVFLTAYLIIQHGGF